MCFKFSGFGFSRVYVFCVATKSGSQLVNILHLQNVYGSSVALSRERRFEKMRWCGGNKAFAFLVLGPQLCFSLFAKTHAALLGRFWKMVPGWSVGK